MSNDNDDIIPAGLQIVCSHKNHGKARDAIKPDAVIDPVQIKFYEELQKARKEAEASGAKPKPMFRLQMLHWDDEGNIKTTELAYKTLGPDNVNIILDVVNNRLSPPKPKGRVGGSSTPPANGDGAGGGADAGGDGHGDGGAGEADDAAAAAAEAAEAEAKAKAEADKKAKDKKAADKEAADAKAAADKKAAEDKEAADKKAKEAANKKPEPAAAAKSAGDKAREAAANATTKAKESEAKAEAEKPKANDDGNFDYLFDEE